MEADDHNTAVVIYLITVDTQLATILINLNDLRVLGDFWAWGLGPTAATKRGPIKWTCPLTHIYEYYLVG